MFDILKVDGEDIYAEYPHSFSPELAALRATVEQLSELKVDVTTHFKDVGIMNARYNTLLERIERIESRLGLTSPQDCSSYSQRRS